jgi:hypothetical protein
VYRKKDCELENGEWRRVLVASCELRVAFVFSTFNVSFTFTVFFVPRPAQQKTKFKNTINQIKDQATIQEQCRLIFFATQ